MTKERYEIVSGWILYFLTCILFAVWQNNIVAGLFMAAFIWVLFRIRDYSVNFIVAGIVTGVVKSLNRE